MAHLLGAICTTVAAVEGAVQRQHQQKPPCSGHRLQRTLDAAAVDEEITAASTLSSISSITSLSAEQCALLGPSAQFATQVYV